MPERSNIWGGSFEIVTENQDQQGRNDRGDSEYDKAAYRSPALDEEEEVKQSWLLRPVIEREKKRKKMKMMRYVNAMVVRTLLVVLVLAGVIGLIAFTGTHHRHHHRRSLPGPDNYTLALHQALMFFNAQRSGELPKNNNVWWRGDSCLRDGEKFMNGLAGGYYDSGDATKFSFPTSFAMTILSWSVLEYSEKYKAAAELDHIKDIIKWGTDYLLKTFNSSANHSIDLVASQVGGEDDLICWVRPEQIEYKRAVSTCSVCPALAAEMSGALASASIVFKDNKEYSKKLVHGADLLFKFANKQQGESYSAGPDPPSAQYNSSGFWDEFVWGGTWLYYATGNSSYLDFVTSSVLAKKADALLGGHATRMLSWDKKHAGAQLLLTRLRMFLPYGFPYEQMLGVFHEQVMETMCSYLPDFPTYNRTRGGLIQLNYGRPRPLQYAVNAAFLATLYSDYLEAIMTPGWYCGNKFFEKKTLRSFAQSQVNYILGDNPKSMSYIVGFGNHFPQQVHHRGASIPANNTKHGCKDGYRWRNSKMPNPYKIMGAMVAGPYKDDDFIDERGNYTCTEPTIAGNAGLVAALVALSGEETIGIDKNTIFYSVPPISPIQPPPPPPWTP